MTKVQNKINTYLKMEEKKRKMNKLHIRINIRDKHILVNDNSASKYSPKTCIVFLLVLAFFTV